MQNLECSLINKALILIFYFPQRAGPLRRKRGRRRVRINSSVTTETILERTEVLDEPFENSDVESPAPQLGHSVRREGSEEEEESNLRTVVRRPGRPRKKERQDNHSNQQEGEQVEGKYLLFIVRFV